MTSKVPLSDDGRLFKLPATLECRLQPHNMPWHWCRFVPARALCIAILTTPSAGAARDASALELQGTASLSTAAQTKVKRPLCADLLWRW